MGVNEKSSQIDHFSVGKKIPNLSSNFKHSKWDIASKQNLDFCFWRASEKQILSSISAFDRSLSFYYFISDSSLVLLSELIHRFIFFHRRRIVYKSDIFNEFLDNFRVRVETHSIFKENFFCLKTNFDYSMFWLDLNGPNCFLLRPIWIQFMIGCYVM